MVVGVGMGGCEGVGGRRTCAPDALHAQLPRRARAGAGDRKSAVAGVGTGAGRESCNEDGPRSVSRRERAWAAAASTWGDGARSGVPGLAGRDTLTRYRSEAALHGTGESEVSRQARESK